MTIEELLDCSAEKLEAMTDSELNSYLSPYFQVTRPEFQVNKATPKKSGDMELNLKLAKAKAIARSLGIDFP